MSTPKQKGDELEDAVQAIEEFILMCCPDLSESSFVVERNKIISVSGVRHEIDIFVKIDHGSGYESVYIFECKNWKSAVGKNEIIVFSEKIAVSGASKGFFISIDVTEDARNQANLNNRVSLIQAEQFEHEMLPVVQNLHILVSDNRHGNITAQIDERADIEAARILDLKSKHSVALHDGVKVDIDDFIQKWIRSVQGNYLKTFKYDFSVESEYILRATEVIKFEKGEFSVNGIEILGLTAEVSFKLRVEIPRVISTFNVATRGRVSKFQPIDVQGEQLHVQLIEKIT